MTDTLKPFCPTDLQIPLLISSRFLVGYQYVITRAGICIRFIQLIDNKFAAGVPVGKTPCRDPATRGHPLVRLNMDNTI